MKRKPSKPYWEMNARELARATREFDREGALDSFGTPPPAAKAKWATAKKKRGRPRVGAGAEKIQVSMERTLLKRADAYAKKHRISRSELIAKGVSTLIDSAA